jgi:enoyl-CoA hydratase
MTATDRPDEVTFDDLTASMDDGIASIVIDRAPVNAFRTQTWAELRSAMRLVDEDTRCRVIVISSANPRNFCAGADIGELPMTPERDEARMRLVREVLTRIMHAAHPVICAVRGRAMGSGCALAAASDICIATQSASFSLPEITVARCGGARHLMRLLPQGVVRRASFTGEPISATDAHRLGMVTELAPHEGDSLERAAEALARKIADKSPLALRLLKESLDLVEELPIMGGYHVEQQFTLRLGTSPDLAEAARAFAEKRSPLWPSAATEA